MNTHLDTQALNWLEQSLGPLVKLSPVKHNHTNFGFIATYGQQPVRVFIKMLNRALLSKQSMQNERQARHWVQKTSFGLTPETLCENQTLGLIVDRYIPAQPEHSKQTRLAHIAQLMVKLHSLPVPVEKSLLPQQINKDIKDLLNALNLPLDDYKALLATAALLDEKNPKVCICHGDLSFENILFGDRPYLIDWEYARIGEPAYDLAACILINSLTHEQQDFLLHRYAFESHCDMSELKIRTQYYLAALKPLNQLWFKYKHQLQ